MNFFLLPFFVVAISLSVEAYSYGENLLIKLKMDVREMVKLIDRIEAHFGKESRRYQPYSDNYENSFRRASDKINGESFLMDKMDNRATRRSASGGNPLRAARGKEMMARASLINENDFKEMFYKALSRVLREEYRNEKVILENIPEDFKPAVLLSKGSKH